MACSSETQQHNLQINCPKTTRESNIAYRIGFSNAYWVSNLAAKKGSFCQGTFTYGTKFVLGARFYRSRPCTLVVLSWEEIVHVSQCGRQATLP
ncbi:unnamed protein product [Cuscuta campestris]|uniref:Uncharacterized protein n=1 Tax=Cuscuta campestris TaxID=132261 RepID=A0A484K561_9ASTE|nr:unnamed protein product [Cuscuta campestris]